MTISKNSKELNGVEFPDVKSLYDAFAAIRRLQFLAFTPFVSSSTGRSHYKASPSHSKFTFAVKGTVNLYPYLCHTEIKTKRLP